MRVYFNNFLEVLFKVRYSSNLYRIRYPLIIKKHSTPKKVELYHLKADSNNSYNNSIYTLLEYYTMNNDGLYPLNYLDKIQMNKGNFSFNYFPTQLDPEILGKNGWREISSKEYKFPKTYLVEYEGVISQVYFPVKKLLI
jgi:hypothetical protein